MNYAQIWYRRSELKEKKSANIYIAQNYMSLLFATNDNNLTQILVIFLAKHLLKIGLPWQQLRSLVTRKYTK